MSRQKEDETACHIDNRRDTDCLATVTAPEAVDGERNCCKIESHESHERIAERDHFLGEHEYDYVQRILQIASHRNDGVCSISERIGIHRNDQRTIVGQCLQRLSKHIHAPEEKVNVLGLRVG